MLQIKAQAEGGDFYEYSAFMVALTALVISIVDAVLDFDNIVIRLFKIVMLTGYALCGMRKMLKYNDVLKWRKYILVAISELEREWK